MGLGMRLPISMCSPDCPANLLDELLVPGEPEGGEGCSKQTNEACAECNQPQNLVACAMSHTIITCTETPVQFAWMLELCIYVHACLCMDVVSVHNI